jgi:hypothetical protein
MNGSKKCIIIFLFNLVMDSSLDPSANQTNYTASTTSFPNETSDHSTKKNKNKNNPEKNNKNQNSESRINNSTKNYNEQPVIPAR